MKVVCIAALLMAAAMTTVPAPALAALHAAPRSSLRPTHPKADQLSEAYTFEQYEANFNKRYATPAERQMRKGLFEQRLGDILSHNRAGRTWKKGVNHLTDRTDAERRSRNGNLHPSRVDRSKLKHGSATPEKSTKASSPYPVAQPSSWDWRSAYPPVLTGVKNQGGCGDCWAFAATEGLESAYALKTGELNVLSPQQVTACTPNPNECGGSGGCNGATAELAYDYLVGAGLTQEWEYPFTAYDGTTGKCTYNSSDVVFTLHPIGYELTMPRNNMEAVISSLQEAPLAITVAASGWYEYESGIYDGCDYSMNISMDHAVQLVGYGTDEELDEDYWIVRNSWGAYWGEDGFIRLFKERGSPLCGWDVDWQDGDGCRNGPSEIFVCGQCGLLYDTLFPVVYPAGGDVA